MINYSKQLRKKLKDFGNRPWNQTKGFFQREACKNVGTKAK